MTDPIPVSQRAREAYLSMNMLPEFDAADVRAGLWDKVTGIQAFARLEAAAYNDGLEASAKVADAYGSGAGMQMGKGAMIAADTAAGIATDIRDLKGRV